MQSSISNSINDGHVTTPWTGVVETTTGDALNSQRYNNRELDETMDRLKVMLQQEAQTYLPCDDYLAKIAAEASSSSSLSSTDKVCDSWRRKLCEWCYSVVDHFNFDREVVFFAMSFLDRTVALKMKEDSNNNNKKSITQRYFQLLAVTCLYLSIKLHAEVVDGNGPRQKLRIGTYVDLSRGLFTTQDIERTELDIFQTLNFQVNPPTAIGFISLLLRLAPKWTTATDSSHATTHSYAKVMGAIFDLARYLSELAVCVSSMTFANKTSITSFASILLAMDSLPPTLRFPGAVRVELLRLIQETTGLHRWDDEVRRVYHELQDLCPMLCQQNQETSSSWSLSSSSQQAAAASTDNTSHDSWHDGKVSPVGVADALDERDVYSSSSAPCYEESSPSSRRKRLHAETT